MEEKTYAVSSSGWTEEEKAHLDAMVKADGGDRSKFLRRVVREEWAKRESFARIQLEIEKTVVKA